MKAERSGEGSEINISLTTLATCITLNSNTSETSPFFVKRDFHLIGVESNRTWPPTLPSVAAK